MKPKQKVLPVDEGLDWLDLLQRDGRYELPYPAARRACFRDSDELVDPEPLERLAAGRVQRPPVRVAHW